MKNIFLIGFMGCGKSTIAAALSQNYGMEIIEMDQVLVEREGMSIPEMFAKHGETYFRDAETALVADIQKEANKVVSCGGGVVLREENVEKMKSNGLVVWLTAEPETILERVKDDHNRPLLEGNKNVDYIRDMMEKRREKYEGAADAVVNTDGKSAETICKEIYDYV